MQWKFLICSMKLNFWLKFKLGSFKSEELLWTKCPYIVIQSLVVLLWSAALHFQSLAVFLWSAFFFFYFQPVNGRIFTVSCFILSGCQWWHCYGQLLQQLPELHRYRNIAWCYWYVSLFIYLIVFQNYLLRIGEVQYSVYGLFNNTVTNSGYKNIKWQKK